MADFAMAMHARLPWYTPGYNAVRKLLIYARMNAIARSAARLLGPERAVIASWGCAEPVFRKAKARGALCVLDYPSAHHRFTRRYLLQEAEIQPTFSRTLTDHDRPAWLEGRGDTEIHMADYILVGSSFARDSFITEGVPPDKVVIIPYGVDVSLFAPPEHSVSPRRQLRLLFVGKISQAKGISYLLEAVRRLDRADISLTLVGQIQGDGRVLEPYRHLFRHVPHVPNFMLRHIYQKADVFVFPTLIEGMGLVVLEAMASGLPVITTPNGPGDIVRDGVDGFVVPPRDVDALIQRIELLRTDRGLRVEMGRNARERALQFTWDEYRSRVLSKLTTWLSGTIHSASEETVCRLGSCD
ncbi:MAG TPA: glycosyltransferase family 4 protein [Firmicutes bacterium]|nr:glycosyltransferase family 4 protein [Bacillota bacterium]